MLLTHVRSFGRFDEITYLVEKTPDLTLPDLGRRVLRSVATSLSQSVREFCIMGNSHPGGLFSGCASTVCLGVFRPPSGLANGDAVTSTWRAPKVERCLFSGPCETGSFARSLQGWIYGDPENKCDPRSGCLSIELDKQHSETQILGQGKPDVPSWRWLSR